MATGTDDTVISRAERTKQGKALRKTVPYNAHAGWKPPKRRRDPVEMLLASDRGRLPELIPIRYGRMAHTPFTFFRGSDNIMAEDLSGTPSNGVAVQLCGDCHLLNFGAFATPERNVVFDINDFDETVLGPWEWDLKRLAVSFVLVTRDNELKSRIESEAVSALVRQYRLQMQSFSQQPLLDIWYSKIDWETVVADVRDREMKLRLEQDLKKAQKKTVFHSFPKLSEKDSGHVIKDNPPLIYHPKNKLFEQRMRKGIEAYKQSLPEDKQLLLSHYRVADIAIKVVGIGSVGTTCAIALLLGPDDEQLFLQLKEARNSVLQPFVSKSQFDNNGKRVVVGQRIVQAASDIFLGWMRLGDGKDFYCRQLRDTKVKLSPETWGPNQIVGMAGVMGAALARAHARSGHSALIAGYLGEKDEFDGAICSFATAYADQVGSDYKALMAAIKAGKVKADDGTALGKGVKA